MYKSRLLNRNQKDPVLNRITLRQRAARLWHPPGSFSARDARRTITFLELFYDLVFVALIAVIAHGLAANPTLQGIGQQGVLFAAAWWAWINGALYHNNHATQDLSIRVFTFAQMFTIVGMVIWAPGVWHSKASALGFASAYAAHHLLLAGIWARTGIHDQDHRRASGIFAVMMLIVAAGFAASPLFPAQSLVWWWALLLTAETLFPILVRNRTGTDWRVTESMVERLGLLVIIMLGEAVIGTTQATSDALNLRNEFGLLAGAFGMLISIGIWWIYFDTISHRVVRPNGISYWSYMYGHMLLMIAIGSSSASLVVLLTDLGRPSRSAQHLLAASIAISLILVALLRRTLVLEHQMKWAVDRGVAAMLICGILIFPVSLLIHSVTTFMAVAVAALFVPIVVAAWYLSGGPVADSQQALDS